MRYSNYQVETSKSFLEFEFYSIGPKGKVKKKISYKKIDSKIEVYNLDLEMLTQMV